MAGLNWTLANGGGFKDRADVIHMSGSPYSVLLRKLFRLDVYVPAEIGADVWELEQCFNCSLKGRPELHL